ncbi:MAG TPA: DoxX family protein [Acidimicrobiales bacterium]|jgi:putative oxidoreductase|nr:DoxX family protein [Acidimicrobiales bacterium]
MRHFGILALRVTVGGYLAVHGAQKLFGHFDGPGLEKAGKGFEGMGLKPGKPFAALAATSELTGGVLTAVGLGFPVSPIVIASAMAVAITVHSEKGAMGQKGGYELPLTDMVAALTLAMTGPGRYSLDRILPGRLPRRLVRLTVLGATGLSAYSASRVIGHRKATAAAASAPAEPAAPAQEQPAQEQPGPDPSSEQQAEVVADPAAG